MIKGDFRSFGPKMPAVERCFMRINRQNNAAIAADLKENSDT